MKSIFRLKPTAWIIFSVLVVVSFLPDVIFGQSSNTGIATFDGPAELPREYVKSSLKDTPASGKVWTAHTAQEFDQVLGTASCGDIIQLQAGATFKGSFTLPAKNCDDSHWIIVRTSAPDSGLPTEGIRLTPCFGGMSALAGRPQLNCASVSDVLPKIEFDSSGSGPLTFASGANHYRLIGLEVTRSVSPATVTALIQFSGPADHLIFDRMWIHGTTQDETARGVNLGQSRYVAVIDSFLNDFHCESKTSSCVDSQAIAGGVADGPMGPYKIVNNFLEASGENVMFGGGHATASPQDIEVRHNHMVKPLSWMKGQTGFILGRNGNAFIVKNLFELKNAQRVLLEGNILENSWGGFSQVGFAILLTPKNAGNCPGCQVTDVTIRYNSISHVGSGIQIGNVMSDSGSAARDGQRYSIHDIVIDDMDGAKYGGPSEFAQISVSPGAPLVQNITIDHVTAFPSRTLFLIGDMVGTSSTMKNFVFINSIANAGTFPVWSTGGGLANCAYPDRPLITFNACFSGYTFVGNVLIGAPPAFSASSWPAKNSFAGSAGAVRFVDYRGGNGGDYHLQPSSPYKGKGTDGKDPGADIDAIHSAIAGAE